MEFLQDLFQALEHEDSVSFLLFMFASFLIGFLTGWILYGGRARRYKKEARQLKSDLDGVHAELSVLKEQLELKDADLVKAEREAEEAIHLARTVEAEKAQLNTDLDDAHGAMETLNAKIHSYTNAMDDLNNQILGLKARNNQLNDDVERESEAMNQLAQMQSSYNASLSRLAAVEKKLENILSENASLKSELDTVKTSTEELKSGTEELKSKTEELAAVASSPPVVIERTVVAETPKMEEPEEEIIEISNDDNKARILVMEAIGSKIPTATADQKDDLTLIKGVGAFIEEKLNGLGIYTYEQISQFDEDLIEKVTSAIAFFPGRIQRDDWVGQATRLMDIKTDNPEALNPKAVFPDNSEDLKIVEGIGPKIEQLLKNSKINTWQELADTSVESLQAVLKEAGDRFRIHDPSTWPMQAQMAADGEWEKLKDYQDFLQGGREKK